MNQSGACCWFVEYYGNKLAHLDPASGAFQEWQIPTQNANPYSLALTVVSGRTMLWGTEFGANKVFGFFPESGTFLEYTLPHDNIGVGYISIEPTSEEVRVWFTETLRNANGEFLFDRTSGNVTLYEDTFPSAVGGGAYGVHAASSSVWFAGFSSLVRWDRTTLQYTIWPSPVHGTALGRLITVDSSGQPWYTQGETNATSTDNFVGVLHGNVFQEWRLPAPGADPRGISINPLTQQLWIAERSPYAGNGRLTMLGNSTGGAYVLSQPTTIASGATPFIIGPSSSLQNATVTAASSTVNQTVGLSDGVFTEYGLGSGQPHDVITDSAGNVWFSEPGVNKIGRISGFSPDFALNASPPVVALSSGESGTVAVTGISVSGYRGSVTLTGDSPAGVTLSFTPGQVNVPVGGNASLNMVINIAANAPVGNGSVTIHGYDGAIAHSTSIFLIVTSSTTSATQKQNPQCLIATATYGSELSPEVEFLRGFRDHALISRVGSSFLMMFNAWYYSFSPSVANYINGHALARVIMKIMLYPLVGFLIIASELNAPLTAYSEVATLLTGLCASVLIGGFYVGLPLGLLSRRIRLFRSLSTKPWMLTLLGGLTLLAVGEILVLPVLLMASSSIIVLSCVFLAAVLTGALFTRQRKRSVEATATG